MKPRDVVLRPRLSVIFTGHVDSGKSSTAGQLIVQTGGACSDEVLITRVLRQPPVQLASIRRWQACSETARRRASPVRTSHGFATSCRHVLYTQLVSASSPQSLSSKGRAGARDQHQPDDNGRQTFGSRCNHAHRRSRPPRLHQELAVGCGPSGRSSPRRLCV